MDLVTYQPCDWDAEIGRLAFRQHGNVTRVQLVGIGLDDDAIAHRVRRGTLHRVRHGGLATARLADVCARFRTHPGGTF